MSPAEMHREVKAVFTEAIETPTAARGAFLDRRCGTNVELRRRVDELLAVSDEPSLPVQRADLPLAELRAMIPTRGVSDDDSGVRRILECELGKQYEIMGLLDRGGMGSVYLARDIELEIFVAIKVLRSELAGDPESRARFKREAMTVARLTHPNIVHLSSYGEVAGLRYFVMDYVPGRSLAGRLRINGPIPCGEACELLVKMAEALEHAHRKEVIHRDIKPANILLGPGGPMLADFGISKVLGKDQSRPSEIRGTPHYMSPEQLTGMTDLDGRSDIYSLGLVGYAMMLGHDMYSELGIDEVMRRRITQDSPPLDKAADGVPPAFAAVIMKCLERDRSARYPDAFALKEALKRAECEKDRPLPDEVKDLPGFGQYSLVWAIGFTAAAFIPNSLALENRLLLLFIACLVPLGLGLHIWNLGRHGVERFELAQIACWPPEWWGMWWPAVIRRPTDLWSRLAWPLRLVRVALSLFFVLVPALIIAQTTAPDTRWLDTPKYFLVLGGAAVTGWALWWTLRRGLTVAQSVRVLFGATVDSTAWRTQPIARLLAPDPDIPPPNYRKLADHPRAIKELAPLLPPQSRALAAEVSRKADELLAAILHDERESASLAQKASDDEVEKLTQLIIELEEEAAAAHAPPAVGAELEAARLVLGRLRRKRATRALMLQRRAGRVDQMHALWTHLARLHEQANGRAIGPPDPSESLRVLCAEIASELAPDSHQPPETPDAGMLALRPKDPPPPSPGGSAPPAASAAVRNAAPPPP